MPLSTYPRDRAPDPEPAEAPASQCAPLRLSVTRGVLGLELYEALPLGPLVVETLAVGLPGLKFPVDLSGGVKVFRHRRGEFTHARLSASWRRLAAWLAPRLRAVLPNPVRAPSVFPGRCGIGVGLCAAESALAFELAWAPTAADARFVVLDARGVGLDGPALGYALRALDAVFGREGRRTGRRVSVPDLGRRLGRAVLPRLGARAPSAGLARVGELELSVDGCSLTIDEEHDLPALSREAAVGLELAELAEEADDQLAAGEIELARQSYLRALERAPRHPKIAKILAEIDVAIEGRAEAALGLLVESMPAADAGSVGAELLARVGDHEAARTALEVRVRDEPYAPLASLMWLRAANLARGISDRLAALDESVARCPGLERPRWGRLESRLEIGDVVGALADAEHLEAGRRLPGPKHAACERAARRFLEHGFVVDAGRLFERALRFVPDDAEATAGLGRALVQAGETARALPLLSRSLELSKRGAPRVPGAELDLARLLADRLGDLPQAVARLGQIPGDCAESVEAQALEGRYRARLGDLAGATLAYGKLRQLIELGRAADPRAASGWLVEAAEFEEREQEDLVAAERHLAIALRSSPADRSVSRRYREVAKHLAERARRRRGVNQTLSSEPAPESSRPRPASQANVQALQAQLAADPDNGGVARELIRALQEQDRDDELFALLSARIEDADVEEREELRPMLLEVLERLVTSATDRADPASSELYQSLLEDWRTRRA